MRVILILGLLLGAVIAMSIGIVVVGLIGIALPLVSLPLCALARLARGTRKGCPDPE